VPHRHGDENFRGAVDRRLPQQETTQPAQEHVHRHRRRPGRPPSPPQPVRQHHQQQCGQQRQEGGPHPGEPEPILQVRQVSIAVVGSRQMARTVSASGGAEVTRNRSTDSGPTAVGKNAARIGPSALAATTIATSTRPSQRVPVSRCPCCPRWARCRAPVSSGPASSPTRAQQNRTRSSSNPP